MAATPTLGTAMALTQPQKIVLDLVAHGHLVRVSPVGRTSDRRWYRREGDELKDQIPYRTMRALLDRDLVDEGPGRDQIEGLERVPMVLTEAGALTYSRFGSPPPVMPKATIDYTATTELTKLYPQEYDALRARFDAEVGRWDTTDPEERRRRYQAAKFFARTELTKQHAEEYAGIVERVAAAARREGG